jgi:hypothetical protein
MLGVDDDALEAVYRKAIYVPLDGDSKESLFTDNNVIAIAILRAASIQSLVVLIINEDITFE